MEIISQPSIQGLRQQLKVAKCKSLGEEMIALLQLLDHPDLEWNDLLNALECTPGVNAETAALEFYKRLKVVRANAPVNSDRQFWEGVLREAGLDATAKAGSKDISLR